MYSAEKSTNENAEYIRRSKLPNLTVKGRTIGYNKVLAALGITTCSSPMVSLFISDIIHAHALPLYMESKDM